MGDPLDDAGGYEQPTENSVDTALKEWDAANPDETDQQQPAQGASERQGQNSPEADNESHQLPSGLDYGPVREALRLKEAEVERERGRQDFERRSTSLSASRASLPWAESSSGRFSLASHKPTTG